MLPNQVSLYKWKYWVSQIVSNLTSIIQLMSNREVGLPVSSRVSFSITSGYLDTLMSLLSNISALFSHILGSFPLKCTLLKSKIYVYFACLCLSLYFSEPSFLFEVLIMIENQEWKLTQIFKNSNNLWNCCNGKKNSCMTFNC